MKQAFQIIAMASLLTLSVAVYALLNPYTSPFLHAKAHSVAQNLYTD